MYSTKESVLQVVALLVAHGVREAVLCPGSRNTPLVASLAAAPEIRTYAVTDERSAGFFALGRALESGVPVAVCCTSGTAAVNLHPAVAEAYYQQVPLVVLTADRPAAWIGQMDGQTLPQTNLFGTLVRSAVSLPEIHKDEDRWYCNRLINEALLELNHHVAGPVQINIPIAEPLFDFSAEELPAVRKITRHAGVDASVRELIARAERPLIVLGQMPRGIQIPQGYVCLSEQIANTEGTIRNFDALLYAADEDEKRALAPDLIIYAGGHLVSKRLKQFLRGCMPKANLRVSETGAVEDLFCSLTDVVECDPNRFVESLAERQASQYERLWMDLSLALPEPEFSFSEMAAVGELLHALPKEAVLHVANSSAVRYAQLFALDPSVKVCCNRGTSGIEGSISTAVGYAAGSPKRNFAITGDLSFFYDMNALWNNHVRNLSILLLNNAGGAIFHILPGLKRDAVMTEYIAAEHHTKAESWAVERGFHYFGVHSSEQLREAIAAMIASPERVFVEVFTSKDEDARALKTYYHNLK